MKMMIYIKKKKKKNPHNPDKIHKADKQNKTSCSPTVHTTSEPKNVSALQY